MTANFHTDIVLGGPNNAATFNPPLGQLDSAITNLLNGTQAFTNFAAAASSNVTISVGVITRTRFVHIVDTEASAATDDLDTINGGSFGLMLIIKNANNARVVVVKHATGNIKLAEEKDYVLDDTSKSLLLFHDGTQWTDMSPARRLRSLGTSSALTIASDSLTVTRSRHTIDTEGAAATDDLKTIAGAQAGAQIELSPVSNLRVITVRHNRSGGNIRLAGQADVRLDDPNRPIHLTFDGTNWVQPAALVAPPRGDRRRTLIAQGGNTSMSEIGFPAGTNLGTPSNSNQADGPYVLYTSGAVAGNPAGYRSTTFNLVRRQWNPTFWAIVTTGAGIMTNSRTYIGLFAALPTNVDVLVTQAVCFRFSTVVPDTNWQGVIYDGTTQQNIDTGIAVNASTRYLLRLRVDDTAPGTAYFSVNNGAEVSMATNLPLSATELGFVVFTMTNTAAAKTLLINRIGVETD